MVVGSGEMSRATTEMVGRSYNNWILSIDHFLASFLSVSFFNLLLDSFGRCSEKDTFVVVFSSQLLRSTVDFFGFALSSFILFCLFFCSLFICIPTASLYCLLYCFCTASALLFVLFSHRRTALLFPLFLFYVGACLEKTCFGISALGVSLSLWAKLYRIFLPLCEPFQLGVCGTQLRLSQQPGVSRHLFHRLYFERWRR